jgi:hypothetical protein
LTDLERLLGALRGSQILRVCLSGVLTVVLLIPIAMIGGLVSERQSRYGEAVEEVSASWGNPKLVSGPALVVPYTERAQLESDDLPASGWTFRSHAASAVISLVDSPYEPATFYGDHQSRIFMSPIGRDYHTTGASRSCGNVNHYQVGVVWQIDDLANLNISDATPTSRERYSVEVDGIKAMDAPCGTPRMTVPAGSDRGDFRRKGWLKGALYS